MTSLSALGRALLVLAVAATGAPAEPGVPGVTDTEVAIGITAALSGPAAIYGDMALARETWARCVNDQAGVHGREFRVVVKDDGFDPGRAVVTLKGVKDLVRFNVGLVGSAIVNAATDEGVEARLPVVDPSANVRHRARELSYERVTGYRILMPLF
jgi:branched-chain amino acid transport system substrate-binding protein